MSEIDLIEPTEKPCKRLFEAGEMKILVHFFLKVNFIDFNHL